MVHGVLRCATLCLALLGASFAHAGVVGFELSIHTVGAGNTPNMPQFELTNFSDSAEITRFDFTIGRADRNFDALYTDDDQNGSFIPSIGGSVTTIGIVFSVSGLDADQYGGMRSDSINLVFDNFGARKRFSFRTDVDIDSANSTENFTSVFFGNGDEANSVASLWFSTGQKYAFTLPESPGDDQPGSDYRFVFSWSGPAAQVSEPPLLSLLLLSAVLAATGSGSRPRKNRLACLFT